MYGALERPACAVLPDTRVCRGGQARRHRREPVEQQQPSAASRLDQARRAAVRLLPIGSADECRRAARCQQEPQRCADRCRDEREHLPLRHVQPDSRRDQGCGRLDGEGGLIMNAIFENSRRDFLKTSALAGGGLLIGFVVPGAARLAHAAADFKPNAFIRITPDNQVTVVCAQSEMGQGVLTAIPMLVAEELEADWSKIPVEQAPSNPAYGNPHPAFGGLQATGGSASVRGFWEPMRKAGATAREMLIGAAADTWKVDRAECRAEKGEVVHKSG